MPLITVTYARPETASGPGTGRSQRSAIAATVSRLSSSILGKDPGVTAIIVTEHSAADWYCAGQSLADAGLGSFWLDIHITDGTNTKDEKARFIAAIFDAMGELLGPLHNESYAHVHDVRADAYGYGGQTQERRYVAGKLTAGATADG